MRQIMKFKHDLFKTNKLTFSVGELVPIGLYEVLPGDIIRGGTDFFTRVAPLNSPPYNKMEIVIETNYVPARQVWEDSEEFHSGGAYGSTPPVHPTINLYDRYGTTIPVGSLADMFGIRPGGTNTTRIVNALPFRVYNAIANHRHIRDDVQTPLVNSLASGTDTTSNYNSIVVEWRKDYFTRGHVRQQKAASILATVDRLASASYAKLYKAGTDTAAAAVGLKTLANGELSDDAAGFTYSIDPRGGLVIDSNDIRDGQKMLRYFENAERRGSNKYSDYISDVFGVSKQDMRLADPMLLSRIQDTLRVSEVIQTAPTTAGSSDGVGEYQGHGIGAVRARGYRQFIPEHGYVMVTAYIRPTRVAYMDGIERMWWKTLKEHYFQPELAHMSQQSRQNREVRADHASPTGTFNYGDIYDEYREGLDVTAGEFRIGESNDDFHCDRNFTSDPSFNAAFLQCLIDPRMFQDTTADHFYAIAYNNVKALRSVPPNGQPL